MFLLRRRRIFVTMAIISTLGLIIYRRGEVNNRHPKTGSADTLKADGYHKESRILDIVHPSVFQQWRNHQPPKLIQSTSADCQQFRELNMQRRCCQGLQHVITYCVKLQAEDAEKGVINELGQHDRGTNNNNSVVDVFSYRQGKSVAMYCSVHKVASTYWIRLFRFLHNDTNSGPLSRPEGITKYRVHLMPFKQARPLALDYITRKLRPGDKQFRFMFTRNPYHRLWAVYIDKFVLPDFLFWSHHSSFIEDMTLQSLDSNNVRRPHNTCFEVSFEMFVRYAVQDASSPTAHADDHILPVSRVCDPCAFQPHFIGSMENMTDDSRIVLSRLNLSHVVQETDFRGRMLNHMRTVVEFVHDTVVERGNLRHCFTDSQLQTRLFRAFVLSGYLPTEFANVRHTSEMFSQTKLFDKIKELFLISDRSEKDIQAQRKQFMVKAYQSLPWGLLNNVRDYYRDDFDLFSYDPEPIELFGQRTDFKESL